jgi:hypothetical protein
VTTSNDILRACLPTSSLAVATGNVVTAYVPNGAWISSSTGVQAVTLESSSPVAPVSIATPSAVNSCSANPKTAQTVCTANSNDVYLISGTTRTNTLTSGATGSVGFSGGSCRNCGVAINALSNKAVIAIGISGSPSGSGIQFLDLATNIFGPPIPAAHIISEDILIDPTRNLILSPGESNFYDLFQIQPGGGVKEFGNFLGFVGGILDSAAEDCSTGIALASLEGSGNLFIADLTQAVLTPGSGTLPGTWTGPSKVRNFPEFNTFSAGTSGISVASGTSHLGIVSGEFGGNRFGVIQLPATSGSGTPDVVDYAAAVIPNTPDGGVFQAGLDPHTVTAYTSPKFRQRTQLMY